MLVKAYEMLVNVSPEKLPEALRLFNQTAAEVCEGQQLDMDFQSRSDVTIAEVAQAIAQTVGFTGQIEFDTTKPDGAPRKWMDSSRLNALGWQAQVNLDSGLAAAYQDFVSKL